MFRFVLFFGARYVDRHPPPPFSEISDFLRCYRAWYEQLPSWADEDDTHTAWGLLVSLLPSWVTAQQC